MQRHCTNSSHLLKTSRHFICWLQPKPYFPSLVPAADSKSPRPQKVKSHMKLLQWEHPDRHGAQRTNPNFPTQHCLYPFPPSQLKKSHLETRDYKLSIPVMLFLCVGTAPKASDLSWYLFTITTTPQSLADGLQETESFT